MMPLFYLLSIVVVILACGKQERSFQLVQYGDRQLLLLEGQAVRESSKTIEDIVAYSLHGDLQSVVWKEADHQYFSFKTEGSWAMGQYLQKKRMPLFDPARHFGATGLYLVELNTPLLPSVRVWMETLGARITRVLGGYYVLVLLEELSVLDEIKDSPLCRR